MTGVFNVELAEVITERGISKPQIWGQRIQTAEKNALSYLWLFMVNIYITNFHFTHKDDTFVPD